MCEREHLVSRAFPAEVLLHVFSLMLVLSSQQHPLTSHTQAMEKENPVGTQ